MTALMAWSPVLPDNAGLSCDSELRGGKAGRVYCQGLPVKTTSAKTAISVYNMLSVVLTRVPWL